LSLSVDLVLSGTDLSTVAILLALLWLDGWRHVPDDAVVVRRVLLGRWIVHAPGTRFAGFAFLAWWPPYGVPLVLRDRTGPADRRWTFSVAVARAERRRRRIAWEAGIVRLIGALLVVWIAIVIPVLTASFGAFGLIRGIASAFLISASIMLITANALRDACVPCREAARRALPLLSPFSASRAPELLLEAALSGVPPIVALRALLGERAFLEWLRPMAFDALASERGSARPREDAHVKESLLASVPHSLLVAAVAAPNRSRSRDDRGAAERELERYCARCGRTFRQTASACTDCGGLPLTDLP
jgi:hypothetical protein